MLVEEYGTNPWNIPNGKWLLASILNSMYSKTVISIYNQYTVLSSFAPLLGPVVQNMVVVKRY